MTNKTHIMDMSGEEMDKRFAEEAQWPTTCPSCKADIKIWLHSLGYAVAGEEYDSNGCCPECDHEWTVGSIRAEVRVIIEEE